MSRKPYCLLLLGALLALFACTNNPYPDTDDARRVLYTSFSEAPKSLDPAVAYDTVAHEITGQVHDTLLEYAYLKRPYTLIPGLATDVPNARADADGSIVYDFELRPGALFQDDPCFELGQAGRRTREIGADDVVFELMRIADPLVNSPVTDPFSNLSGFAEFSARLAKLLKAEPAFKALPARERYRRALPLAGVRVVDATHLQIRLKAAYPQILYWFAMPFTTPVPWEAVEYYTGKNGRAHLADHPVASGPYLLSTYDKQSRMVLDKNPNWYGIKHPEWHAPGATYPSEGDASDLAAGRLAAAGKALPLLDSIDFRREKEAIPAFTKFIEGYYDTSGIIRESFDKMVKDERLSPEMQALGMRLDKSVTAAVYYIGFNMDDSVVGRKSGEQSKKLRQAMSLAVDTKEYTRLFMNRRGVPAESVLAPGIFGYEADYKNPYRHVDLAKAKALLIEAGYPDGIDAKTGKPLHLTFDTADTSPDGRLRYQFFVNAWRQLGIDVEIAATNYNKFQAKVHDGAYQIFLWGWVADYPDAENFMFLLTSDMARTKNDGPNTANFSDPEFDRLFLAMKTRDNDQTRLELIRKMRSIVEDQCPWIPLFHPEDYSLVHAWVHNLKSAGLSVPTLKYHDLEPGLRREKRAAWNRPVVWPAYALGLLLVLVIVPGVMTFFAGASVVLAYIVRRTAYGVIVVLGVLFFLFTLFFLVTKPDDIARKAIGEKAMPSVIVQWKKNHGYDRPLWPGPGHMKDNMLVEHYRRMLTFDFGRSDADDTVILDRIKKGAGPSLSLTLPEFVFGILLGIGISLFVAFFRETYIDRAAVVLSVLGMSISSLLYIIGGQYLIGKELRWFPISGFDASWVVRERFLALPVLVGVAASLGASVRFYRTVFIEDIYKDYVRTARAKGAGEVRIMTHHVLQNAMIPILTSVVTEIPFLLMGSLLLEASFGIPGLGSLTVDAITANDFATLRTMVYIGSLFFVVGQIVTDISYTIADPRIRLD